MKELTDVDDDSALSYRTAAKWVAEFNNPTRAFEDAPQSARPPTAMIDESIRAIDKRS